MPDGMSCMITSAYVRTMATYNAEMNRRLYEAASRIPDDERKRDRGAFWGSIHGTLNHILYGDRSWMSRFDGWPRPEAGLKESAAVIDDFGTLRAARVDVDDGIIAWAWRLTDAWLEGTLFWHSNSANRDLATPRSLLVTHLFNHQAHHRGQAHALVTAAGQDTDDTDLFLLTPEIL
jgi:uncharacterized damage-inducible protein DinB